MKNVFAISLLLFLISSCQESKKAATESQNISNSNFDGCDSLAITKAVLKKIYTNDFRKTNDFDSLKDYLPGYIYKPAQIITRPEAVNSHLRYLQSLNPILDNNRDIVHYLNISESDLKVIAANGTGGARLYFCNEDVTGNPKTIFNIIVVPVDKTSGDNVLFDGVGNSTIVNKLEPCPDNCINGSYGSINSENDLNFEDHVSKGKRWFKPNKSTGTSKNHWWSMDNSTVKD